VLTCQGHIVTTIGVLPQGTRYVADALICIMKFTDKDGEVMTVTAVTGDAVLKEDMMEEEDMMEDMLTKTMITVDGTEVTEIMTVAIGAAGQMMGVIVETGEAGQTKATGMIRVIGVEDLTMVAITRAAIGVADTMMAITTMTIPMARIMATGAGDVNLPIIAEVLA
jgi:hypothetical protein